MSDFDERLKRAVARGTNQAGEKQKRDMARAMSEDDFKTLHGKYRLQVSEHIEQCVKRLPNYFPGFRFETIFGERGWGAACSRDDFGTRSPRGRSNLFSRLEMTVRPYSPLHVLELAAKGTIKNKEVFNRTHFKELEQVAVESYFELVDAWAVEYAERFAAEP